MQIFDVAVGRQNAEFVKPNAAMLLQQLAHDLALDTGSGCFQDFLERRRITAPDRRASTFLADRAPEIAFEVALCRPLGSPSRYRQRP